MDQMVSFLTSLELSYFYDLSFLEYYLQAKIMFSVWLTFF